MLSYTIYNITSQVHSVCMVSNCYEWIKSMSITWSTCMTFEPTFLWWWPVAWSPYCCEMQSATVVIWRGRKAERNLLKKKEWSCSSADRRKRRGGNWGREKIKKHARLYFWMQCMHVRTVPSLLYVRGVLCTYVARKLLLSFELLKERKTLSHFFFSPQIEP